MKRGAQSCAVKVIVSLCGVLWCSVVFCGVVCCGVS